MNRILIGDNRETLRSLPDRSVDCCVTSPPYWGLRSYLEDAHESKQYEIGGEKTPDEYVSEVVAVFGEVHRVLADHGTLWLNLGDSYAQDTKWGGSTGGKHAKGLHGTTGIGRNRTQTGLPGKNLVGIPWRVAFALQAAGWIVRSEIIWHKPAPMPAAVRDRCTTSHEPIFLLTKKPRYYYDWYAISEPCSENTHSRGLAQAPKAANNDRNGKMASKQNAHFQENCTGIVDRRNKRSVWKVTTESYSGAHFAVYPTKLVEPCILAGCPETVCIECGKPWVRVVDTERVATRPGTKSKIGRASDKPDSPYHEHNGHVVGNRDPQRHATRYIDKGFQAACECNGQTRKGIVLDPFLGSGTTAQVAQSLGRDWIGCELNPDYVELINRRTQQGMLL